MFYLLIGLRNLLKNLRRSLLTMISIMIGMISCVSAHGFFNWNSHLLREAMIHNGIGHYQLYAAGFARYSADEPYRYLISEAEPILKELRRIPEVKLATTRMTFNGLISTGEQSIAATGEAGIPQPGSFLQFYANPVDGTHLPSGKSNTVVVGEGVARKLSARIGDTVTLMGNMKGGGINALDLKLVGITRSGSVDLDNVAVATNLDVMQRLLNLDRSVQKIVVLLQDTTATDRVLPQIKVIAQKYHLEYRSWESLAEMYQSVKGMYDVVFEIIIAIVLAIVIFTISNTVNLNLSERFREIGTIRALGTRRDQVAWLFIAESGWLGLLGGLGGLLLSMLWVGVIEAIGGLPVTIQNAGNARVLHVFFHPSIGAMGLCLALFTLVAVCAALIPARRAARMPIAEALRAI